MKNVILVLLLLIHVRTIRLPTSVVERYKVAADAVVPGSIPSQVNIEN